MGAERERLSNNGGGFTIYQKERLECFGKKYEYTTSTMIKFRHRETNEEIFLQRVRTYINDDGSKRNVDLSGRYDLSMYEEVREDIDYKSIAFKKAPNDIRR